LFLGKITEIGTTRCQILRLKCTKFDFGLGFRSTTPDPLAGFKGALLLRVGEGRRKGREGEGVEEIREGEGWEGKGGERRRELSHQSKSTKICPDFALNYVF